MPALPLVLLWFGLTPATNQTSDVAHRLEARYRTAKTLEASFIERYSENGQIVRVEAGRAYFRKPGKMRWEYEKPENDLFLVDGKTAWFYVPADHTVTRMPAKQSTDFRTPLALLAGEMKLSRVCARVEISDTVKPQIEGGSVLRCALRGDPDVKSSSGAQSTGDEVFIEVVAETGNLARILVRQPAGIEVEFGFRNWQFDHPLPAEMFRFDPPSGVAIVNGALSAGN